MKPQAAPPTAIALALIAGGAFLAQFDIAATVVATPMIAAELALDLAGFAWVMDAYSLAFVGALAAAGVLADRHGRRRTLVVGVLVFAAASLGCALAPHGLVLLLARAAQGVGAALIICGGLALLSGLVRDGRERARSFGTVGVITGIAMAFGPAGGGAIAAAFGWRWIFLINLPLCAGLALALPRVVAESRDPDPRPVDIPGMVLLTAGLAVLVAALLHGAASGWGGSGWSGATLAGPPVAILLLAAFVAVERRQRQPMIDLALLTQPPFAGICLVALLMSVSYWAVLVYLPLLAGGVLGMAPGEVGLALLAATLPMLVLPPLGARLVTRLKRHRFFALGFALNVAGDLVLALAASAADPLLACVGMALTGSGTGLVNAQISSLAIALAPAARAGMASGIAAIMRQGGFALGIAALGMAATSLPLLFAAAAAVGVAGAILTLVLLRSGDWGGSSIRPDASPLRNTTTSP